MPGRIAILGYIAQRSSTGPVSVLRAIEAACVLISEHPEAGQATRRSGIRVISVSGYPYRMFYSATHAGISVLHIRHTSRRPWAG